MMLRFEVIASVLMLARERHVARLVARRHIWAARLADLDKRLRPFMLESELEHAKQTGKYQVVKPDRAPYQRSGSFSSSIYSKLGL